MSADDAITPDTPDTDAEAQDAPEKVTVQPAAPWPQFDDDIARREIAAMELLHRGIPAVRVHRRTGLSMYRVRRLAVLLAEEAKTPPRPRNVLQEPRPRTPGRITVRGAAPKPAPTEEPEQLTLL
ncbi:hypothetical protein ACFYZ8_34140 [Streptomyces sp. NPDC001668]|uniref:hypothetical protein n=1 Tax=Streptomyces sp. NPDC001668 TaxID=3364598 RepID=UPI0036C95643